MYFFCYIFFFLNLFYLCHILFHFDDMVQPPNNGVTTLIYLTLFETFQIYVHTFGKALKGLASDLFNFSTRNNAFYITLKRMYVQMHAFYFQCKVDGTFD